MIVSHAMTALARSAALSAALALIGLLIAYPLRWLDVLLQDRRVAFDVGFANVFFGRKRSEPVPDREILRTYERVTSR
jgi:hypothetical protein